MLNTKKNVSDYKTEQQSSLFPEWYNLGLLEVFNSLLIYDEM